MNLGPENTTLQGSPRETLVLLYHEWNIGIYHITNTEVLSENVLGIKLVQVSIILRNDWSVFILENIGIAMLNLQTNERKHILTQHETVYRNVFKNVSICCEIFTG